jgi:hypothetical protein
MHPTQKFQTRLRYANVCSLGVLTRDRRDQEEMESNRESECRNAQYYETVTLKAKLARYEMRDALRSVALKRLADP